MAELHVGKFVFHYESIRTQEYSVTPVYDAAGNYECNKVTLDVVGIVNRVALATRKVDPTARVNPLNTGDTPAVTIAYLQDYLKWPRHPVRFVVQDTDVIEWPRPVLAQGTRLTCDVKGGPFCERIAFTQFSGDRTLVMSYRVVIHETGTNNIILSHCWNLNSSIDQYGYTTRTTQGRVAFRKDFMDDDGLQPDDFRNAVFPVCPFNMRRVGVDVRQPEHGNELHYTVVDREVTLGLGRTSDVLEVVGTVSSSLDRPIKDLKGFANMWMDMSGNFFGRMAQLDIMGAGIGFGRSIFNNVVPTNMNVGVARAIGRKGANRATLAAVAIAFIADRFKPIFDKDIKGSIASTTLTHNFDTENAPFAEVKLIFLTTSKEILEQIISPNLAADKFINTSNVINQGVGLPVVSASVDAPHLSGGDNSRGARERRMLTQVLISPPVNVGDFHDQLPDAPPRGFEDAVDALSI